MNECAEHGPACPYAEMADEYIAERDARRAEVWRERAIYEREVRRFADYDDGIIADDDR